MAILLQVENLTKSYGDRLLFADVSFTVEDGDRIGLIAKNGTGKSTMLEIIAGHEDYDSGRITFRADVRTAILEQTPHFESDSTPRQYFDTFTDDDEVRNEAVKIITQIGEGLDLDAPFGTFSGGQIKRVALASALALNSDLLILDEPTNHLDIRTIEWLENYLARRKKGLLMVTHDRYFLERVCNRIIEIDREQIYSYPGNYAKYLEQREHRIETLGAELAKVKNLLRKEQDWMSRQPQARAGKAKYRIDAFYELKERSKVNLSEKNIKLTTKSTYIGKKIFHAENVSKSYGEKCVLRNFSADFARYEKVGIVGGNGVGKTTFVKMLQGIVAPDEGFFDVGETVTFGYYGQERAIFPPDKKVIDVVTDIADEIDTGRGNGRLSALQYLQHFLFDAKDQQKYVANLSGGELSRLYLATVLMRRPNFLILDEPTNDLDIVTLGILEEYLIDFEGCVIVISHDRYFLDNIVDHILVMEGDGMVRDFPGNYTDYRKKLMEQVSERKSESGEGSPVKSLGDSRKPRNKRHDKMSFKEKREFETLEKEIAQLTAEKQMLEEIFKSGAIVDDIAEKSARYEQINSELDEKEMRWLELSEKS